MTTTDNRQTTDKQYLQTATGRYAAALIIVKVLLWKALYDYYHHWTALDPIAVVESLCIQTTTGLRPCLYHCMYLQHCQCVWSSFIIGFKEYLKFSSFVFILIQFHEIFYKGSIFHKMPSKLSQVLNCTIRRCCHQKLCHIY